MSAKKLSSSLLLLIFRIHAFVHQRPMRAAVDGEFRIPSDDAGLRKIVDRTDMDFLTVLLLLRVVPPHIPFNRQRRCPRHSRAIVPAEFVRFVRRIISINRKIVVFS